MHTFKNEQTFELISFHHPVRFNALEGLYTGRHHQSTSQEWQLQFVSKLQGSQNPTILTISLSDIKLFQLSNCWL